MSKKIIIVDNDETLAVLTGHVLEEEGYKVDTVDDYNKLKKSIDKAKPQLIILDYRLDRTTGADICKALKKSNQTATIPVVVYSSENVKGEVTKAGASDFFKKPFEFATLIAKVETNID